MVRVAWNNGAWSNLLKPGRSTYTDFGVCPWVCPSSESPIWYLSDVKQKIYYQMCGMLFALSLALSLPISFYLYAHVYPCYIHVCFKHMCYIMRYHMNTRLVGCIYIYYIYIPTRTDGPDLLAPRVTVTRWPTLPASCCRSWTPHSRTVGYHPQNHHRWLPQKYYTPTVGLSLTVLVLVIVF